MPFLRWATERCELRPGPNVLGGPGEGAVPLAPLAALAPTARIVVHADGTATLERLAPEALLRLDGEPVDAAPRPLRHGAHVDVEHCVVSYGDPAPSARADHDTRAEPEPAFLASAARARLVDRLTARAYDLATAPAVIGRDAASAVVVGGSGVSRRHAAVRAGVEGYTQSDESADGTLVNGEPVTAPQLLADDDVVRVGAAEWRFEERAAGGAPAGAAVAHPRLAVATAAPAAPVAVRAGQPLGTLQITRGALLGRTFPLERVRCARSGGPATTTCGSRTAASRRPTRPCS
jgi:hypothetical protein